MYLKEINILNFKNLSKYHNTFSSHINIIKGRNASGKTNLLDAIHILLNTHSFVRRKNTTEFNQISIKGTLLKETTYNISIYIDNKTKKCTINDKQRNLKDFKILFPTVVFSIKDFINFNEKKYILTLLDKISFIKNPDIVTNIIQTSKQIKLKQNILNKKDYTTLKIINQNIRRNIQTIQNYRTQSTQILNSYLQTQKILPKNIKLLYNPNLFNDNITNLEQKLSKNLLSVYKDEIKILLDEKDIFGYSSLGEKKMVLFSIIIALIRYYNESKKFPIILIDDLEGDISTENLEKIIETIKQIKNQIFITTLGYITINNSNTIELSGGL